MLDIAHEWAGDLGVSPSGDLALAADDDAVKQRVYRRLLTNPRDYIWNLEYGGGLSAFIGKPIDPARIEAIVRDQLGQESSVAQSPSPQVGTRLTDAANGYVVTDVTYTTAASNTTLSLSVSAG
jgi:hypothetical protein